MPSAHFLAYYLLIGGNLARLNAASGWPLPAGLAWQLAAMAVACLLVRWLPPSRVTALIAAFLLALSIVPPTAGTPALLISRFVSYCAAAVLLTSALTQLSLRRYQAGVARTALLYTGSALLFVLLIFAYYITFQMRVPFGRPAVLYALALLLGVPVVAAWDHWGFAYRPPAPALPGIRPLAAVLAVVFLLLLGTFARWQPARPAAVGGPVLRVFNYNLHNGFSPQGGLGLEALARTIEAQSADVVALQEVSRGWVINGSVDLLAWLSLRLGQPGTFSPAAGQDWGHGVLSRLPVTRHAVYALPPPGLPLARSFAYHEFDLTGGLDPEARAEENLLRLVNTHLHHTASDGGIRAQQAQNLRQFLSGVPKERLLLVGDFNAEPQTDAIQQLLGLGLRDLIAEAGLTPGYTYSSTEPVRRIDYILASPDFGLRVLTIPDSAASDHLGILAELLLP